MARVTQKTLARVLRLAMFEIARAHSPVRRPRAAAISARLSREFHRRLR